MISNIERIQSKIPLKFLIRIRRGSKGDVKDLRIKKGLGVGFDIVDEGLNEIAGLATTRPDEDTVSPPDMFKDPFLLQKFFRILLLHLNESLICLFQNHISSLGLQDEISVEWPG